MSQLDMAGLRMSDSQQPISTETALLALTKPQRRRVLHRVADEPGATSVDQLAAQLRQNEADSEEGDGDGNDGQRRVELHHRHLPMLGDAGVVSYDAETGTVRRGEHFREVYSLLQALDDHRDDAPQN